MTEKSYENVASTVERLDRQNGILREVENQVVLEDEQNPGRIPSDIVTGARAALEATKPEGA